MAAGRLQCMQFSRTCGCRKTFLGVRRLDAGHSKAAESIEMSSVWRQSRTPDATRLGRFNL